MQLAVRALRASTPNVARASSSLEKIEASAARMARMLTTLLDSSRIVLGDLALATVDSTFRRFRTIAGSAKMRSTFAGLNRATFATSKLSPCSAC